MRALRTSEIIGGLFIGAVLLFLFTRKDESQQISDLRQSNVGINNWKSLNYIQDFDDVYSKMIQSVKPVIQSETQNVEQGSQIAEQVPKEVEQTSGNGTEYKNNETWKIERDANGDISEISVMRNARIT